MSQNLEYVRKLLCLSNEKYKTRRLLIFCHKSQRKAVNPRILQAGSSMCSRFLLEKMTETINQLFINLSFIFLTLDLLLIKRLPPCFQWWPSTTTARTRTTSCRSWRAPSFTSSRRTTTAGSRASPAASPDSSPATTWSPSCTTPTEVTWQ